MEDRPAGVVMTWGLGGKGALGHDKVDKEHTCPLPAVVPGLNNIVQVACGEVCTAAVAADGRLFTWGSPRGGRLGHGPCADDKPVTKPRLVQSLSKADVCVIQVSVGENHTACVAASGLAYTWGNGASGSLGHGTSVSADTPTRLDLPGGTPFDRVVRIECGFRATAVTRRADTESSLLQLWAWGDNKMGKLGLGHADPVMVPALNTFLEDVRDFALGSLYGGAVCGNERHLYMWGYGGSGNLGLGSRKTHFKPQLVQSLEHVPVRSLHCTVGQINPTLQTPARFKPGIEGPHTLVVAVDGSLFAFGTCNKGQLGNMRNKTLTADADELAPYRVGEACRDADDQPSGYLQDERVMQAVSSSIHSAVVCESGRVYTFGCASDGRMGVDKYLTGLCGQRSRLKCYISEPTLVDEFVRQHKRVVQLSSSRRHMAAVAVPEQESAPAAE